MGFYVYILYSSANDKYYIGHTEKLENRIYRHNNRKNNAKKYGRDWTIVYFKELKTRSEACKEEMIIKKKKSRKYIEWLISSAGQSVPQECGKIVGSTPISSTKPPN